MEPIKKIDMHAHAVAFPQWVPKLKITGYRFINAPELISFYDRLNIEKGVLLPIVSMEGNWHIMTNENCKLLADTYPDRFLWFCNVDPRAAEHSPDADLLWIMEHYKALGAKGVGELTSNLYADDPMVDNLFAQAAQIDFPVTIHISPRPNYNYGIVDDIGLPRLEKMLKKHPDVKILGHSQPFWAEMSADLTEDMRNDYPKGKVTEGRLPKLMREYGNLFCDLSAGSGANALMRDPEYAARFMEEFADRILYACDFCTITNAHQFAFNDFLDQMVTDGMLSEENYRKIVRGNAERLLKL